MEHAAKRLVYAGVIFILLTISAYSAKKPYHFTGSTQGAFNMALLLYRRVEWLDFHRGYLRRKHKQVWARFRPGPSFIVGYFTLTSLTGFTATDTFSLQLNVDPSGGWSPDPMIVQASLFPNLQTNVLAVNFNGIGGGPPLASQMGYIRAQATSACSQGISIQDKSTSNIWLYHFHQRNSPVPSQRPSTLSY